MKLLELYEDFFQYLCRLNRVAKTSAQPDYGRVRAEIKELLEDVQRRASGDARMISQVRRLELPLIFVVDFLIRTSRLKFATQWGENSLGKERNDLAGDERFFDFVDEDMKDTSEDAGERLAVYYVCLGLGFTGMYMTQPEQVRRYVEGIFPRIKQWVDSDPRSRINPEAYQHTDTRVLTEPPNKMIKLIALGFLFLCLCVLIIQYGLYARAVGELSESIKIILKEGKRGDAPPK